MTMETMICHGCLKVYNAGNMTILECGRVHTLVSFLLTVYHYCVYFFNLSWFMICCLFFFLFFLLFHSPFISFSLSLSLHLYLLVFVTVFNIETHHAVLSYKMLLYSIDRPNKQIQSVPRRTIFVGNLSTETVEGME